MVAFREEYGWGRAIAAPQIGVPKQIVFLHVDEPQLFLNPAVFEPSSEMTELWDDCMSFPDILVKVQRHLSCQVTYRDDSWQERSIPVGGVLAELLQHEIDHLHGILTTMRVVDGASLALQSQRHHLGPSGFANSPATI